MSGVKRRRSDIVADDDSDEQVDVAAKQVKVNLEPMYLSSDYKFAPKPAELTRFEAMHEERKNACIKAVFRFFVFKGSRKEHINRAAVGEVLAQIEPECKKSVSAVLSHVQDRLLKLTGYLIVPGDAIKGYSKGKRDELYLVNTLLLVSPSLSEADVRNVRAVLQNGTPTTSVAFQGFKFVIFHLIYSGNGHKITLSEISRQLHKLDIRFPKTLSTAAKTSTSRDSLASVPELGQSLLDMLERLRKEEYVVVNKDEADSADTMRNIYEWGPRFYLEIGVRNLLISYYHILGQPVDEMELKLLEEANDESEDDDAEN